MTTTLSNLMRASYCTTRSIAGAETQRAKPITGRPTRQSHERSRGIRQGYPPRYPAQHHFRRSLSSLVESGAVEFWRTRRANRCHASHSGGGKELDFREQVLACAQLL